MITNLTISVEFTKYYRINNFVLVLFFWYKFNVHDNKIQHIPILTIRIYHYRWACGPLKEIAYFLGVHSNQDVHGNSMQKKGKINQPKTSKFCNTIQNPSDI